MSDPKYFYHYTSHASAQAIMSSGQLHASTDPRDCKLGQGVYFTSKPPQTSNDHLLYNNYDGSARHHTAKVESFIRVDASKVGAYVDGRDRLRGRDVFMVPGNVDLNGAGVKTGDRKRYAH